MVDVIHLLESFHTSDCDWEGLEVLVEQTVCANSPFAHTVLDEEKGTCTRSNFKRQMYLTREI